MNIVYITDENYIMPTAVSITSLVMNAKTDLNIYIICNNPSDKIERLRSINTPKSSINIINVNGKYDLKKINGSFDIDCRVTETALLKFFIPEILDNLNKVLYIDGDTVVNKDLSDLYVLDLGKDYLAAAKDPIVYLDSNAFKIYTRERKRR